MENMHFLQTEKTFKLTNLSQSHTNTIFQLRLLGYNSWVSKHAKAIEFRRKYEFEKDYRKYNVSPDILEKADPSKVC